MEIRSNTSSIGSRERVLKTINREMTDRMPIGELCLNDGVVQRELSCEGVGFEERLALVEALGLDIITLTPEQSLISDGGIINSAGLNWPDLKQWTTKTNLFTFAIIDCAFESGVKAFSFMEFLMMIKREREEVEDFIEKLENLNIAAIKKLHASGVDGIILADDVAFSGGLFTRPTDIRELFIPSLAKQAEVARSLGMKVFFHCDGNYNVIIPDIIEAGFHGIQCLEKKCGMDIFQLQRDYGDKLCLWGHLDTEDISNSKDPEYLNNLYQDLNKLHSGKGIILGTNSGVFEGMDLDELKSVYRLIG